MFIGLFFGPTGIGGLLPGILVSGVQLAISASNTGGAWDNAKNLDAFTLSAWSHNKNSPWDKAYNATPKQVYISEQDMKAYFDQFFQNES